jgi:hypothetical protein
LAGSGYRPRGQGPTHRTHLPADPDAAAGVLEPPRHLRPTAGAWGRGAPVWQQSRPVVLLAFPQAPAAPPSRPPCRCRGGRPRRALALPLLSTLPLDPLAESAALSPVAGTSLRPHSLAPLLAASPTVQPLHSSAYGKLPMAGSYCCQGGCRLTGSTGPSGRGLAAPPPPVGGDYPDLCAASDIIACVRTGGGRRGGRRRAGRRGRARGGVSVEVRSPKTEVRSPKSKSGGH